MMKKTLIAIAALAATSVFAQSSVTISGTFDPSFVNANTTLGDGTSSTANTVGNNNQGTTVFALSGVEDLGGGLKALFRIENNFNSDDRTALSTGQIYTGLQGGFGSIKVGAPNTPSLTTQISRSPFVHRIGSGFGGVTGTSKVRHTNSMVYASPSFSGFSAAIGYVFETAPAAAMTDIGLNYGNGPLKAGLSYYKQSNVNNQTNLYVNYAFGPATVYAGYHKENKIAAGVTSTSSGTNIGVKYAVTKSVNLLANHARLNDQTVANLDRNITGIGAQYVLSKRTSAYARYVQENNSNVALSAAKGVRTTLVGLQHNF